MTSLLTLIVQPDGLSAAFSSCLMRFEGCGFNRWEKEQNKSESVRAEFDLCSHQGISMAGLNLLSPKLKQTVNCCYTKAVNVLH